MQGEFSCRSSQFSVLCSLFLPCAANVAVLSSQFLPRIYCLASSFSKSLYLPHSPPLSLSLIHPSIYLSILSYLSIYLSIYSSIHPPTHSTIDRSIDRFIHPCIYLSVSPSIHLTTTYDYRSTDARLAETALELLGVALSQQHDIRRSEVEVAARGRGTSGLLDDVATRAFRAAMRLGGESLVRPRRMLMVRKAPHDPRRCTSSRP